MSEVTITSEIKSIIENIGINNVHDYIRWAKDKVNFHKLFKDTDKIYGWEITCPQTDYESINPAGTKWLVYYTYEIIGWLSLSDQHETEKTMRAASHLVMLNLLKGNEAYNGNISECQVKTIEKVRIRQDHAKIGDVLCHRVRMSFVITEVLDADNITEYEDMYYIGMSYSFPDHDDHEYESNHVPRPGEDEYDIDPDTDEVDDLVILDEE